MASSKGGGSRVEGLGFRHAAQQTIDSLIARGSLVLFTEAEILRAVDKIKVGKCSGMSGVSGDFIKALASIPEGLRLLKHHLDLLLQQGELPEAYYDAFVLLLPKVPVPQTLKDLRPINLIESTVKLYCSLLCGRLRLQWKQPELQYGGLPGTQVLEAMFLAHMGVRHQKKCRQPAVWFLADISSAFDSVDHGFLATFLNRYSNDQCSWEAGRLLHVLTNARLHFDYCGRAWVLRQQTGVQQGGSHSCYVFATIVGNILDTLHAKWQSEGISWCAFLYTWGFVDDIFMCCASWADAHQCSEDLRQALATAGLRLNTAKCKFLTHPSMLQQPREEFPEASLARVCPWDTRATYLRKQLSYESEVVEGENLMKSVVQLANSGYACHSTILKLHHWNSPVQALRYIQKYIFSKFAWFLPLLPVRRDHVQTLRVLQVTLRTKTLHLYLPGEYRASPAMCLQRLRRRAAYAFLSQHADCSWIRCWYQRRFTFLGHLLRKGPSHPLCRMLLQSTTAPLGGKPGPWASPMQWLQHILAPGFPGLTLDGMFVLANDRPKWKELALQISGDELDVAHIVSATTWESPRMCLQHTVDWSAVLHVWQSAQGGYEFAWLDVQEGWYMYRVSEFTLTHVQDFLSRFLMLYRPFTIQLLLSHDLYDALVSQCIPLHHSMYTTFRIVLLFEVVPESWLTTVRRLAVPREHARV